MIKIRDNRVTIVLIYCALTCVPAYKAFTVTPKRIRQLLYFHSSNHKIKFVVLGGKLC